MAKACGCVMDTNMMHDPGEEHLISGWAQQTTSGDLRGVGNERRKSPSKCPMGHHLTAHLRTVLWRAYRPHSHHSISLRQILIIAIIPISKIQTSSRLVNRSFFFLPHQQYPQPSHPRHETLLTPEPPSSSRLSFIFPCHAVLRH